MNQDSNNQNYNPQNDPYPVNSNGSNQNQQPNFVAPSIIPFSPNNTNLDMLSKKSHQSNNFSTNNNQNTSPDLSQSTFNQNQFQPNDQFNTYNPYQNTGANIQNLENFAPQENFDTGFGNTGFNPTSDFNQVGIEQYKSATPQFNTNDPYLMPSTNPENDDLDEPPTESQEKPKRDTKKILMFGLIGLIVVLLVASLALFFLFQNNKSPAVDNSTNPTIGKPTTQGLSSIDKTIASRDATDQSIPQDIIVKTGNINTPASKSIVNANATELTNDWLSLNFAKFKGAIAEDASCKLQAVCGPKSDPDKDGLENLDEFVFGTNPNLADVDADGISDKDELYVYYSNPKNADTNENTYSDGVEITNCYDPNMTSQKLTKARLNEISSNVSKPYTKGLSTITQTTLKTAGAKTGELEKGYLNKCVVTSTQEDEVVPKASSDESKTPLTPQKRPNIPVDTNTNEGA